MELVHLHMKIIVKLDLIQKVNRKMMIHEFYSLMYRAVNSNLEAVLKFRYKGVVVYAERLFFSTKKGCDIFKRLFFNYYKQFSIYSNNFIKENNVASFVYGGTKIIGDNFKNGYIALVRIRYPESTVNSFLIKILNENNFGCLPSQSI